MVFTKNKKIMMLFVILVYKWNTQNIFIFKKKYLIRILICKKTYNNLKVYWKIKIFICVKLTKFSRVCSSPKKKLIKFNLTKSYK